MGIPYNTTFTQGSVTPVSADSLNGFIQIVASVVTLRRFTGVANQTIWMLGTATPNDGGQSLYFFNALSTAPDNGGTIIAPTGSTTGRWLAQSVASGSSSAFAAISVSGAITLASTTTIQSDGTTITLTGKVATTDTATLADLAITASHAASNVLAAPSGSAGAPTWRQLAVADVSDAKSMAQQAASNVAITGGTIDNTVIGSKTAVAGTFTTATGTTAVVAGSNGNAGIVTLYPNTSNRGVLNIETTANTGATDDTLVFASQAGARTFTVPDPGATSTLFMLSSNAPGTSGMFGPNRVPLESCRNLDGSAMAAAAGAGTFGISITAGTSMFLVTQAANSSTVTDNFSFEFVLPMTYIAAQNITLTVGGNYVLGGGTIGTHTLAMNGYLLATAGTMSATLIATAAQSVPASAGSMVFVVTGATLTPGCRMLFTGTATIQDTGASNITGRINSISLT